MRPTQQELFPARLTKNYRLDGNCPALHWSAKLDDLPEWNWYDICAHFKCTGGDRYSRCGLSGGMSGYLRAYSTDDARLLWEVDTARDYPAVNGGSARGGAMDGPGPIVVDGMLYVN